MFKELRDISFSAERNSKNTEKILNNNQNYELTDLISY